MADDVLDKDLLARAAAGESLAFEQLVRRHSPSLMRFAARMCDGDAPGQDAVQDGLLAAWRAAGGYRG